MNRLVLIAVALLAIAAGAAGLGASSKPESPPYTQMSFVHCLAQLEYRSTYRCTVKLRRTPSEQHSLEAVVSVVVRNHRATDILPITQTLSVEDVSPFDGQKIPDGVLSPGRPWVL